MTLRAAAQAYRVTRALRARATEALEEANQRVRDAAEELDEANRLCHQAEHDLFVAAGRLDVEVS